MKVCKFGGTSMADSAAVKRVADIVLGDDDRRIVVVSAPGKRYDGDVKVTDALYDYYDKICAGGKCDFSPIAARFCEIAEGIGTDVTALLKGVEQSIQKGDRDFAASRGEYLSAVLLARAIGAEFVDSVGLIVFDDNGELQLEKSEELLKQRLDGVKRAVLPGFYGSLESGGVKTFSRGGSDITGAIVAAAMEADVYENWTDVDGFLTADPRIVKDPSIIECLSYKELRELAYMGAQVLHPYSIYPVKPLGIPINIKNTFNPDCPGTMIVPECQMSRGGRTVTGIAGKKGFTIITIEKDNMNGEIGFGRRALSVLEREGISYEHMPSGIDTLSIVIRDENLKGKLTAVIPELARVLEYDSLVLHTGMSLIAAVGSSMSSKQGTAATLFGALAQANVNVRMIDQGSSELNIIVGVDTADYERAINAIYKGFNAASTSTK